MKKRIIVGTILLTIICLILLPHHTTNPTKLIPNSSETIWENKIKTLGPKVAYDQLKKQIADKPYAQQHTAALTFGEALYKIKGLSGVSTCDASFGYGCYHSFYTLAILRNGLTVIPQLNQECVKKQGIESKNCIHGIGHGVLEVLGETKLTEALTTCKNFSYKSLSLGCTQGVFMEYNFHTMDSDPGSHPRILDATNLYSPCDSIPEEFVVTCYFEQPSIWARNFNNDYARVFELCSTLPAAQKRMCYIGTGSMLPSKTGFNIQRIRKICDIQSDAAMLCRLGAAWGTKSNIEHERNAAQLCEMENKSQMLECINTFNLPYK